jgi:hypothetical protein
MVIPLHHTVQVIFVVLGLSLFAALLYLRPQAGSPQRRTIERLLQVLALASVLGYLRFFSFHPYGPSAGDHAYHYNDAYHYYIGAKYFPEVGYFGLYESTLIAFEEMAQAGAPVPRLLNVRDLKGQHTLVPSSQLLARREEIKAPFSTQRWQAYKADLAFLLSLPMSGAAWLSMLGDMGFNSPPTWNVTASPLANLIPLNPWTLEAIGFIDFSLVLVLGGWLVRRAFGTVALSAFVIAFSNNWIASYDWTGGSFLRLTWLGLLVAGISCIKLERWFIAGLLLGMATMDRIWPGFFLLGAVISLICSPGSERTRRPAVTLLGGAVVAAALLIPLSAVMFPLGFWADFLEKLWKHNSTYFAMHVGFQKLAVYPVALPGPGAWAGDSYLAWQHRLSAYYHHHVALFSLVKLLFCGSAFLIAARAKPWLAALVLGATLLYFTSMPANYYYGFLALFAVVFYDSSVKSTTTTLFLGLFLLLLGFLLAPLRWPAMLVYNANINGFILAYLILIHGTLLTTHYQSSVTRFIERHRRPAEANPSPPASST